MAEVAIIKNEYATLMYYPDSKIVHHTFLKPISGKEFRNVLNTGAKTLEENKASKWLSDDRKNSALPEDDTEWSKTDWFPRAVKAGWKYWALVVPDDFMGRVNMKEFVDSYLDQGLRIAVFTEPEEALKWLTICDLPPNEWIGRLSESTKTKGKQPAR
jgi:hypothetical protein